MPRTEAQHYVILSEETGLFWNALSNGWDIEENATIYPAEAVEQHWDKCDAADKPSCPVTGAWVPVDPTNSP